jgi:putative transcriptional regulator
MYTFIETRLFTNLVGRYLSDEEYASSITRAFTLAPFGCSPSMQRTKPKTSPRTSSGESRKKSMVKTRRDIGQEILDGILELKRGEMGRVTEVPSVASIREATGLSQARFAQLLGVSTRTLQEWEQGRRAPSGAARTLLLIAHRNPKVLLEVA